MSGIHKFGTNSTVGASFETIWPLGGTYPFLETAAQLRVRAGGSVNDAYGGSGAWRARIWGLDALGAEIDEILVLAGSSASALTTQAFLRVNRANCLECGTFGASNDDDVIIETAAGTAQAVCVAGRGGTQQAAGLQLKQGSFTTDGNAANLLFQSRRLLNHCVVVRDEKFNLTANQFVFPAKLIIPPLTDLWVEAQRVSGGNNVQCEATFGLEQVS